MGHRNERVVADRRRFVLVVIVLAVTGAVATRLAGAGFPRGVEVLIGIVLLAGLALAFGPVGRRRWRRGRRPAVDAGLVALATRTLAEIDRAGHRHLEVDVGGPMLVVGPTGVAVVSACPLSGPLHLTVDGPLSLADGQADPVRWAELRDLVADVRRIVADADREVSVRGIVVVARGTQVTGGYPTEQGLSLVPVDGLATAVAQGPLLPMPTVRSVFERLSRELSPGALLRT